MIRNLLAVGFGVLTVGCANTQETLPSFPKTIPTAWAQQPDEKGNLSVGRVVGIEPRYEQVMIFDSAKSEPSDFGEIDWWGFSDDGFLSFGEFLVVPFLPFAIFTGDLAGLFVPDESPNKVADPDLLDEKINDEGRMVYRHVIRLTGTNEEVVRDEFFTYKVGDCVALRSKPELLVPAIPDQC